MKSRLLLRVCVLAAICLGVVGCSGFRPATRSAPFLASGTITVKIKWPTLPPAISISAKAVHITISRNGTQYGDALVVQPTSQIQIPGVPIGELVYKAKAVPNTDGTGTPVSTSGGVVWVRAGADTSLPLSMATTIASLSFSPGPASVAINHATILTALALDKDGNNVMLPPSQMEWSVKDPAVCTLTSMGVYAQVFGASLGQTQVTLRNLETGQLTSESVSIFRPSLGQTPWPMFHGDPTLSGRGTGHAAMGYLKWKTLLGSATNPINMSPVIGLNGLILAGPEGVFPTCPLYALDPSTGKVVWSFLTSNLVFTSPAIGADGTVYYTGFDGMLHVLDGTSGKERWVFLPNGNTITSSPVIGPTGIVYFSANDFNTYAIDGITGQKLWSASTDLCFNALSMGPDGTVYTATNWFLYALNGDTGKVKWTFHNAQQLGTSPVIGPDGSIFVSGWTSSPTNSYGTLYRLDPATGIAKWQENTYVPNHSTPAIGKDGTLYFGSTNQHVYALDGSTGSLKWECKVGGSINQSSPAISSDGLIYIGAEDGLLYAIDSATGAIKWTFATGGGIESSPAIGGDGTVYVGSNDGNLYAIN